MHLSNRMKPVLVLALVAALLGGAHVSLPAQATGTVRGKVVEAGSQRGLSGVQVFVPGSTRGALTNAAGDYLIVGVPAAPQTLRVQMLGYGTVE